MMRWFCVCLIAGMAATGCSSPQPDAAAIVEGLNEEEVAYTAYDEQYEWFVLTSRLEAGQEASMLVHITRLEDFKPLPGGRATLTLDVQGNSVSQSLEEMAEPGIFTFAVTPAAAGEGHLLIRLNAGGKADSVAIGGITVHTAGVELHEAGSGNEAASADDLHEADIVNEVPAGSVTFTKEQSWMIDFATARIEKQPFGTVIRATALIQPAANDATLIPAKTSGIVVFSDNALLEGNPVEQGKPLLVISGSGLAENNAVVRYHEARNNLEKAESDFQRLEALHEENIVSDKEYLQASTAYENARLVFENLEKHFTEEGEIVTSPVSGYVQKTYVTNGQYVEAGQPLLSVFANRELTLRAEVPQDYLTRLASITGATLHDVAGERYYTLDELSGSVLSIGRSTADNSLLIPVMLRIRNNGTFVPGSFIEVFLQTRDSDDEKIVVPTEALIEEMGNFFIYVQHTPEVFEKREVHRGDTDGLSVEITEGLTAGERVVTRGAIMIKLSSAGGNLDPHAGHIH